MKQREWERVRVISYLPHESSSIVYYIFILFSILNHKRNWSSSVCFFFQIHFGKWISHIKAHQSKRTRNNVDRWKNYREIEKKKVIFLFTLPAWLLTNMLLHCWSRWCISHAWNNVCGNFTKWMCRLWDIERAKEGEREKENTEHTWWLKRHVHNRQNCEYIQTHTHGWTDRHIARIQWYFFFLKWMPSKPQVNHHFCF